MNLFVSAANSVASSGNVDAYAQSATFASNPTAANAIDIGTLIQNQSQLSATSKLATTNSTEYYSFNFQQGSAIKLAFNNTTQYPNANAVRVQLYNSSGSVLADNYGTSAQQQAYIELTSGVGLGAANGNYTVKVSVPPKQALTATQSYNLQLYSGTSYAQSYQTTAKLPSASSNSSNANSYGSNLNVYEAANAQSFSRSAYNSINQNALSATNIGWLSENKTSLSVLSQLTTADSADYYSFTFQQGSSAKFKFTNSTNTSDLRVQLYDVSGLHVIADNYGTAAQQTAFNDLTSSTGLNLKNEQYTVKVSYAPNADRGNTQTYNFALYSGLSYTQQDHTTASAQTYQNAILNGTVGSGSYNAGTAAASYLNDLSNGSTPDVMSALTAFV